MLWCLIFCGSCIVIYLRNKNQKDALFYSQFISIINLYVFRAGLLLIMRRYFSVYTGIGMSCVYVDWLLAVGSYCANVVVLRTHTVPNSCGHMLYRIDVDTLYQISVDILYHRLSNSWRWENRQTFHLGSSVEYAFQVTNLHQTYKCGRKVMKLATLCTNRQRCCLPLHMTVNPWRSLSTSLNLLQLLRDCWERLKWSCVWDVCCENGPAKVWATLCHQILRKAWRIRCCDLWKVTKSLWRTFPIQGTSVQMAQVLFRMPRTSGKRTSCGKTFNLKNVR